ncbi:MAG: transglycosylase SLT domain-containing protein [Acidobacteriia bacterium]|nr:transglycosylase SLT domain-containing protein [Terriglobia bacterium]
MLTTERVGPIAHDPAAELWAWGWLVHSEPQVRTRLLEIARFHGWDPNALAAVIAFESGGDPSARNRQSSATGLIQFMPQTAEALGTSIARLRVMSALRQLDFVERYYQSALYGKTPTEVGDYYMAVFMPGAVGKPDELELGRKGQKIYDQNAGLDRDGDGVLNVGDVKQTFRASFLKTKPSERIDLTAPAVLPPPHSAFGLRPSSGRRGLIGLALVSGAGIAWWLRHKGIL